MRRVWALGALLAFTVIFLLQTPDGKVRAQEKSSFALLEQSASEPVDPAKEADIRALLELTGAAKLGDQMQKAFLEQVRAGFADSLPQNERSKRFMDTYIERFQKKFNPQALTELTIPIYDKHISAEDLKGLLAFYRSPLGQRTLKALPLVLQESRETGAALEQKAAQETLDELKGEYPEFMPDLGSDPQKP